jgi:hypothetical protein
VILSGRPNYGLGSIPNLLDVDLALSGKSSFYKNEAKRAVDAGMCIDLIFFPVHENQFLGLPSLKYLSTNTGGNISIYSLSNSLVARDM